MVEVINAARDQRGLATLRPDDRLATAARGHAEDISRNPGMVHIGSDGSDINARIQRAGYHGHRWGEVVGWGYEPGEMVAWWLASPDHVGYVLDASMTDVGAGYAAGGQWGRYWTVNFGAGDSVATHTVYVPVVMGGG